MRLSKSLIAVFVTVVPCLLALEARGQTNFNFTPVGSVNSFETSTNWSPSGPPGLLDTALFNNGGTYAVAFNSAPTNDGFQVSNGDVTFRPLLGFQGIQHTYTLTTVGLLSGGNLTLTGNGNETFLLRLNNAPLFVGIGSDASLRVQSGGGVVNDSQGAIGQEATSTSSVTVDGAGATWTNLGNLFVGGSGDGSLMITGGGSVSNVQGSISQNETSTSSVTVDGAGSTWTNSTSLFVGGSGDGSLMITGGGSVSNVQGAISQNETSTSSVTVDGAGSTWTNSTNLIVGGSGDGSLMITGGGSVSNVQGAIGFNATSTSSVTVDGAGSTWTNSTNLIVGNLGNGMLEITGGGSVSNVSGVIGNFGGSIGEVTVDGSGSTWTNSGTLNVGFAGAGKLNLRPGGVASASDSTRVFGLGLLNLHGGTLTTPTLFDFGGDFDWQSGRLNITGSQGVSIGSTAFLGSTLNLGASQSLGVTHKLTVEPGSQFSSVGGNVTASEIEVAAGGLWTVLGGTQDVGTGLLNNGTVVFIGTTLEGPVTSPAGSTINIIGSVTFEDLVSGAGGFFGSGTTIFNGGHNPGDSPALVPVEGDLVYGDTNTLGIELGGLDIGEFDALTVQGNVEIDGNLVVEMLAGFTPNPGDQFEILDVEGTLSGQFTGLDEGDFLTASGLFLFTISYTGGDGNDVVLTAFAAVPEPSTTMLTILGIIGVTALRRHSRTPSRARKRAFTEPNN